MLHRVTCGRESNSSKSFWVFFLYSYGLADHIFGTVNLVPFLPNSAGTTQENCIFNGACQQNCIFNGSKQIAGRVVPMLNTASFLLS